LLNEPSRRWLKFLLAVAVSVVFTYLFLRGMDLGEVGRTLTGANYLRVVPALGLFAVSMWLRALRWQITFKPCRDVHWSRLLPSLLVGYAGNNLLPLRAGELLRAQHLADREGIPRMLSFGTYMMERLFDGLILVTFLLWGLLLVDVGRGFLGAGLVLAALTAAGFVVCIFLANRPQLPAQIMSRNWPLLSSALRLQIASLGESFIAGFSGLRDRRLLVGIGLTSGAAWALEFAMYWMIAAAFELDVGFVAIAFTGAAANVAMSVPSAQGFGPFQFFAKESLLLFGVVQSTAAAYALALHFFLIAPVSVVGVLVLWRSALPISAIATTLKPHQVDEALERDRAIQGGSQTSS
jgi:glycosyltransferase 2 family protein